MSWLAVMLKGGESGLGLSCGDEDGFFGVTLGFLFLFVFCCWKLLLCQMESACGEGQT